MRERIAGAVAALAGVALVGVAPEAVPEVVGRDAELKKSLANKISKLQELFGQKKVKLSVGFCSKKYIYDGTLGDRAYFCTAQFKCSVRG
ncbi:MAG TPA: hypothetical protein IGS53_26720 [Leptolyngbyaceae cyanobacterium M33_DOE_097]|nr:hypothetical protein [Leptolyngbyaceae cyanobacterium M33_DOE_097]